MCSYTCVHENSYKYCKNAKITGANRYQFSFLLCSVPLSKEVLKNRENHILGFFIKNVAVHIYTLA